MKRLLLASLVLFGLNLALCIGAKTIGNAHPSFDIVRIAGLDYCDSIPCFEGVVLGKTSRNDAMGHFNREWGDIMDDNSIITKRPNFQYAITTNGTNQPIENKIWAQIYDGSVKLTLGEVVAQYGPPCLVSFRHGNDLGDVQVNLIYPYFEVDTPRFAGTRFSIFHSNNGVGWKMPIGVIEFNSDASDCSVPEQLDDNTTVVHWMGFRVPQLNLPPNQP